MFSHAPIGRSGDVDLATGRQVAGVFVGGIGVVLGLAGLAVIWFMPGPIAAEHARLSALPAPSAVSLTDLPAAREVILEGYIAAEQPVLFRNLVAYVKQEEVREASGDKERRVWRDVERRTPLLLLDGEGGRVAVVNTDYDITGAKEQSRLGNTRYRGLVASEAVFVRGRAHPHGIEAIVVGSGTRESYLAEMATHADIAWWVGTGLEILGAVLVVTAGIFFWTAQRLGAAPPEPTA